MLWHLITRIICYTHSPCNLAQWDVPGGGLICNQGEWWMFEEANSRHEAVVRVLKWVGQDSCQPQYHPQILKGASKPSQVKEEGKAMQIFGMWLKTSKAAFQVKEEWVSSFIHSIIHSNKHLLSPVFRLSPVTQTPTAWPRSGHLASFSMN